MTTASSPAPVPVAVLVSGGGTNLQALLDAFHGSALARIARVVSSRDGAGALERARRGDEQAFAVLYRALHPPLQRYLRSLVGDDAEDVASETWLQAARDPDDADELVRALGDARLAVLAGYLKRVPPAAVARFRWRLINIHPALLPDFGGRGMYGRRVHEAVLSSGAQVSGATVHYVDEEFDRGPIIAQWPVPVQAGDTPDSLAARVLEVEHRLLPLVVQELARQGVPQGPVKVSVDHLTATERRNDRKGMHD